MPLMFAATIVKSPDKELQVDVWFHAQDEVPQSGFIAGQATSADEARSMLENCSQVWCMDVQEVDELEYINISETTAEEFS